MRDDAQHEERTWKEHIITQSRYLNLKKMMAFEEREHILNDIFFQMTHVEEMRLPI